MNGDFHKANVVIDSERGIITQIKTTISHSKQSDMDEILAYPQGSLLLPGMIDIHVHFRDLNQRHKETIKSGSMAAAAGGVTTAFDMPNKNPPITNKHLLETLQKICEETAIIDVFPYLQLTPDNAESLEHHPWIKIFLGHTFGARQVDEKTIIRAFDAAFRNVLRMQPPQTIFSIHCEEPTLLQEDISLSDMQWDDFLKSNPTKLNEWRPKEAEIVAIENISRMVQRVIQRQKTTEDSAQRVKIHIAHLSTKEGLDTFLRLRNTITSTLITLSAEVTPHHLWFDQNDLKRLGVLGKVNPPLRTKTDVNALREALKKGLIPIIATDHAPHLLEEKHESAPSGMPGVETALPVLISLFRKGILNIPQIVTAYSTNPAALMGILDQGFGIIKERNPANLVVVNPKEEWKVKNDDIISQCGWTPFEGEILHGRPIMTFYQGKIVHQRE